jgi:HAD superfamily hydrolase (TIGR01509 family)
LPASHYEVRAQLASMADGGRKTGFWVILMIKAVHFDFDGTLVDSETFWYSVHRKVFADYGIDIGPKEHMNYWIKNSVGSRGICQEHGIDYSLVAARFAKELQENYRIILPMKGAVELVNMLHENNIQKSIVTFSSKREIEKIIGHLEIYPKFSAIIGKDDVSMQKPDPEGYLKAAEKLNIAPEESVGIEDTPKGVAAVKNAGMKCIAVPTEWTLNEDFSRADLMVKSLSDITLEKLRELC